MSGWYLWKTDRKTSIQLTLFVLIVIAVSIIIRFFFSNIDGKVADANEVVKEFPNGDDEKAVLFMKYGGATTDNSLQVSVLDKRDKIKDDEVGNVFTSDVEEGTIDKSDVSINWKSSDTLEILYNKRVRTFIKKSKYDSVRIFYKEAQ